MSISHVLKTHSKVWPAVADGRKTCEIRYDDRGYQVGDRLILEEYDPDQDRYTGRSVSRVVTHILRDTDGNGVYGLADGFVVLSLAPLSRAASPADPTASRPPVVTLCGSMRFFPGILRVAAEETLRGRIVLAPFAALPAGSQDTQVKADLDRLHRCKIDMSDEVIAVTDSADYVGESTRNEIRYAVSQGKYTGRVRTT